MSGSPRTLAALICAELAGQKISLKEITQARNERRKLVRQGIDERLAVVEQFIAVHQPDPPRPAPDPVVPPPELIPLRILLYTPSVTTTPRRIEKDVAKLRLDLTVLTDGGHYSDHRGEFPADAATADSNRTDSPDQ